MKLEQLLAIRETLQKRLDSNPLDARANTELKCVGKQIAELRQYEHEKMMEIIYW